MKVNARFLKVFTLLGSGLSALLGLGVLGLRVQPAPFPAPLHPDAPMETIPLPAGLPAPVERFYRQLYGERVPLIRSAVISGRGTIRPFGSLRLPMRFRFIHNAGHDYRHYIEATICGLPVMKVNEYFVQGKERMELPFGVAENDPRLDQGGNLGMWAEALASFPAILLTDKRVHWEAVDETTALLVVPFGAEQERFVVRFDQKTGLLRFSEVMRYRGKEPSKILWITETRTDGMSSATWLDQGSPWLILRIEDVVYNTPVNVSLAAKGP